MGDALASAPGIYQKLPGCSGIRDSHSDVSWYALA